jgi:hypothetical protein
MSEEEAVKPVGEIIVTLESDEKHFPFADFSVTFDSTPDEILEAVAPAILEQFGVNIKEDQGEYIYTVKKVESSGNVYVFPKSPAGNQNNN